MSASESAGRTPAMADWRVDPAALGIHRSVRPKGTLPHLAEVLDAASDPDEGEIALEVELLNIDATSYRALRVHGGGDAATMAALIRDVVAGRGKMQNPWTGSGGVLIGKVTAVGERVSGGPSLGERIVPLVSLIAIPLRLDEVGPLEPSSPQVPARGRAIMTGRMPWAPLPADLPHAVALTAYDVYPVAFHVRAIAARGSHVLILGSGHAGLLAAVAALEAVGSEGRVSVVDVERSALARVDQVAPGSSTVLADATSPTAVTRALRGAGLGPADLTLVCTSAPGCEGTAVLATAEEGTILFFSTATSFAAAALGTDPLGSMANLVIPNGCTADRGSYTLDLLRRHPALREAFSSAT